MLHTWKLQAGNKAGAVLSGPFYMLLLSLGLFGLHVWDQTLTTLKSFHCFTSSPLYSSYFLQTVFNGNGSVLIILWNSNRKPLTLRSLWGRMYVFHHDATSFCIAGCSLHRFSITSCCWFVYLTLLYILHMEAFISLPGTFDTTTQAPKSLKCTVIIKNCLS